MLHDNVLSYEYKQHMFYGGLVKYLQSLKLHFKCFSGNTSVVTESALDFDRAQSYRIKVHELRLVNVYVYQKRDQERLY